MTGLDRETLREQSEAYLEREAFAIVEADRLETLPTAFADGSYLWKDCEWVIRWYLRRPLDGRTHPEESAFRRNEMGEIEAAIDGAVAAESPDERLESLLTLDGVDVPVASAFLQFIDPADYAALAEPCWTALLEAEDFDDSYPDPVRPSDYERYLTRCRQYADLTSLRVVDVGRALWRLGR